MKKIHFSSIMIAFALVGCKANVEVETKLSSLLNQPVHTEQAISILKSPHAVVMRIVGSLQGD